jgi:hypothetical protein
MSQSNLSDIFIKDGAFTLSSLEQPTHNDAARLEDFEVSFEDSEQLIVSSRVTPVDPENAVIFLVIGAASPALARRSHHSPTQTFTIPRHTARNF